MPAHGSGRLLILLRVELFTERRRCLRELRADAVVRAEELSQSLAHGARVLGVPLTCAGGAIHETMLGEPADKPAPMLEIVATVLEICGVDEFADQLQICHNLCESISGY